MKTIAYILYILLLYQVIGASTYYVSQNGSKGNPGTEAYPWQTLQYAAGRVEAGDSVLVANGTYAGFSISTAGDSLNPIVFKASGSEVLINQAAQRDNIEVYLAHYVVIEGFIVSNAERAGISVLGYADNECLNVTIRNNKCLNNGKWGIFTAYAKGVVIESNETAGSGIEHGVYISNSSDYPILRNNNAHHNNGSGIQINADPAFAGDGIVSFALVENNVCYENGAGGGAALNFASIRNCIIKNNLMYDNHAGGMAFWDDGFGNNMGCKDNKIYNNTVIMPSNGRWALNMINTSTGNEIINNILLHKGNRGGLEIDASSMDGLVSDYNILSLVSSNENRISLTDWQNQSGQDLHSFSASPEELFVGSADYHLKDHSPAIDKGLNLVEVKTDFEGDARPAGSFTDIGADEFVATGIESNIPPQKVENLKLLGNYPNPFNGNTVIKYRLNKNLPVQIRIFDTLGNVVYRSELKYKNAGLNTNVVDTANLASGIYYYQLQAGIHTSKSGRMILIK